MAAAAAGIDGVPLFVFGERLAVAGAQPESVLRAAIEQALAGTYNGTASASVIVRPTLRPVRACQPPG